MSNFIDMKELTQITDRLCKAFYRAAERHRVKMAKAFKKVKTVNGGKEIRTPLNYRKGSKP